MPHLTGLAALAATESSSDKTTTPVGFTSGLSMWKDPFSAAKELTNIGTMFDESTEKGMGFLLVPVAAVLVVLSLMRNR